MASQIVAKIPSKMAQKSLVCPIFLKLRVLSTASGLSVISSKLRDHNLVFLAVVVITW